MTEALELRVEREGERLRLLSPEVGLYTAALERGALVAAGTVAGVLVQLGVRRRLVVPAGVEGRVASDPPERVHHPLGYGDVVLELEIALELELVRGTATAAAVPAARTAPSDDGRLVLHATTSGRFWHRPAPGEPAFVSAGSLVKDGEPVGLLEVMKTFSHATYRAQGGLPAVARVVALLVRDGGDVRRGDALLEVTSAESAP